MERIKHHFCWVKAVLGSSPPVAARSAQEGADIQIGLVTPWPPEQGSGAGPIVVAPHFGTVEPIALHDGPLPPIAASALGGVPRYATVPPEILPTAALAALSSADLIALGGVPDYGTVPPEDLPTAALAAVRVADLPPSISAAGAQVPNYGTVPPLELAAENVAPFRAGAPLIFAGATFAGAWNFEPSGAGSVSIVFQPIVGTRQDALAWLHHSEAGRQWSHDALAISLMSFAAIGEL